MAEKKIRLEIILSQALEEDFLRELYNGVQVAAVIGSYRFTQISGATGRGYSAPKLGDAVWPQENVIFVLYCADDEAEQVLQIIANLRLQYAGEGLACFKSEAEEL